MQSYHILIIVVILYLFFFKSFINFIIILFNKRFVVYSTNTVTLENENLNVNYFEILGLSHP